MIVFLTIVVFVMAICHVTHYVLWKEMDEDIRALKERVNRKFNFYEEKIFPVFVGKGELEARLEKKSKRGKK